MVMNQPRGSKYTMFTGSLAPNTMKGRVFGTRDLESREDRVEVRMAEDMAKGSPNQKVRSTRVEPRRVIQMGQRPEVEGWRKGQSNPTKGVRKQKEGKGACQTEKELKKKSRVLGAFG